MILTIIEGYLQVEYNPGETRDWANKKDNLWANSALAGNYIIIEYNSVGLCYIHFKNYDIWTYIDKWNNKQLSHHEINQFVKDMLLPYIPISHSFRGVVSKPLLPKG